MVTVSDYIKSLDLAMEETKRCDCPVCHGRNTFTVTRSYTGTLYNCYKNSCKIRGSYPHRLSASEIIASYLHRNAPESYSEQYLCRYNVPPYVVPYTEVEHPIDPMFLDRYGIKHKDVMYDIRQDRVVFLVYTENNVLVDAVGRSMTGRTPKWLRYAASPMPYVVGVGKVAVIVEDAISAYVISECEDLPEVVGIALLGTQLTDFHRAYIKKGFDKLIVALDPDARDKTLKIAKELNAKALNLKDDLKYRRTEDLNNLRKMLDVV